jgi:hypothetical protein
VTAPSFGAALLRGAPAGTFTLGAQPALIDLTMTSWSKVIRRGFLAEIGLEFPGGIHEDVPVSCAVLLSARRISALARVCYSYRRTRRGSFRSLRATGILTSRLLPDRLDPLPSFAERAGTPGHRCGQVRAFGGPSGTTRRSWHRRSASARLGRRRPGNGRRAKDLFGRRGFRAACCPLTPVPARRPRVKFRLVE